MGLLQIRLSEKTIEEARKIGENLFGNSTTDDKTFWTLVLEYQKSEAEKELFQKKLEEVTEERNEYQMDLNMCILEKEQLRKELEEYKKEKHEDSEKVINRCVSLLDMYLESKTPYTDGLFKGAYQVALMVLADDQIEMLISKISKRDMKEQEN